MYAKLCVYIHSFSHIQSKCSHLLLPCYFSTSNISCIFFFPQISYVDILGPEGRRMKRHLAINCMQDLVICWWSAASDGAWPWSPISCQRDRANLLLLGCAHGKLEVKWWTVLLHDFFEFAKERAIQLKCIFE